MLEKYVPAELAALDLRRFDNELRGLSVGEHLKSIENPVRAERELFAYLELRKTHSVQSIESALKALMGMQIPNVKKLHMPLTFLLRRGQDYVHELTRPRTDAASPLLKPQLDDVVGNERALLEFVWGIALRRSSVSTGCMQLKTLSATLGMSLNTLKVTIHRLQRKGLLQTLRRKSGRGGWVEYRLPEDLQSQLDARFRRRDQMERELALKKLVEKFKSLCHLETSSSYSFRDLASDFATSGVRGN